MLIWIHRIYLAWFACGFLLLVFGLLPDWLEWANSVYLILAGITALAWIRETAGTSQAVRFGLLCGGVAFAAEWIGVHTGWWFGVYQYTERFAPLWFGVPAAIPLAWCMILCIAKWLVRGTSWLHASLAALLATAIDVVLDPVAVQQQYWLWTNGPQEPLAFYGVPLTNFLCWWITALFIYKFAARWELPDASESKRHWMLNSPLLLLVTVEALFIALAIQFQLWGAVLLNIGLVTVLLYASSKLPVPARSAASRKETLL